ncbi:DUF6338 family protein [Shewanella mangrovisoli]|uniref:DUF6338 family protein n=1 Tax=Shewanella mangrovisoli TaxID=2864211 RepID=UPI0035BA9683
MNIWELDKLFLFIAFIIPGFISIKAYEILIPTEAKDSSKQVIDALTYSCINYALMSWFILEVEAGSLSSAHPSMYKLFYLFVLFISPIILVLLWKKIRCFAFFSRECTPSDTETLGLCLFSKAMVMGHYYAKNWRKNYE